MSKHADYRIFDVQLSRLVAPFQARLAARLQVIAGLRPSERQILVDNAVEAMLFRLSRRLSRLLVLELNAARVEGRLTGATSQARWQDFLDTAKTQGFWDYCWGEYPDLRPRVERLLGYQCDAIVEIAQRWCDDRATIAASLRSDDVEMIQLALGRGDTHHNGRTVSIVETNAGPIVYKPRSLAIDIALGGFLRWLGTQIDQPLHVRVPQVIDRGDYGWAEFVGHEYAANAGECADFYRGIGQILAVMRLLSGTDLHAENLIAHRGTPVLVDCETLFTPYVQPIATGYGEAYDFCLELARGGVLAIGLLPDRGQGLGWRGVDMSGIGGLSGQQPRTQIPAIVDAGLDTARVEMVAAELPKTANHPSPTPAITKHWPDIIDQFTRLSEALRSLDQAGLLQPVLDAFAGQQVRVVVRPTETYAEIERMLWHPAALAHPDKARAKAEALFAEMAENIAYAPSDPQIIAAEVEELRHGDIPVFATRCDYGALAGPGGREWLPRQHLVALALDSWRQADLAAEAGFIQASVISAYVSDGYMHDDISLWVDASEHGEVELDRRRRAHAARIMVRIAANGHREADGTIAWVAPILSPAGWAVLPMEADLYAGLSGLALTTAAYRAEVHAGRADPVDGLDDLQMRIEHSLELSEHRQLRDLDSDRHLRPPALGGYAGAASQIWTLLTLDDIEQRSAGPGRLPPTSARVARALRLVPLIANSARSEDRCDLLYGLAGAIPPLVQLAGRSDDPQPLALARALADQLVERAAEIGEGISWPLPFAEQGIGGFSHGTTGIGWALQTLHSATSTPLYAEIAERAFRFEDGLYDPDRGNWRDLRELDGVADSVAWCHGAVGIGLAHLDLHPRLDTARSRDTVRIALDATFKRGLGWNHCICHGDFGAWDLIGHDTVRREMAMPMTAEAFCAALLASLDRHGPTCGVTRDAFLPALFTGHGGIVYQLLRMHTDCALPSALMLGRMR